MQFDISVLKMHDFEFWEKTAAKIIRDVAVLSRRGWETQASLQEEVTFQLELVMEELHQWRGRQFTVDLQKTHM